MVLPAGVDRGYDDRMNISKLFAAGFRAWFGTTAEVPAGLADRLVLVADGCGGFDVLRPGLASCDRGGRGAGPGRVGRLGARIRPVVFGFDGRGQLRGPGGGGLGEGPGLARRRTRRGRSHWWGSRAGPGSWSGPWRVRRRGRSSRSCCWPRRSPRAMTSPGPCGRSAREMVVFWSPLDLIVLGGGDVAVRDGGSGPDPGAGLVGFRRPSGGGRAVEVPAGPMGLGDGPVLVSRGSCRAG